MQRPLLEANTRRFKRASSAPPSLRVYRSAKKNSAEDVGLRSWAQDQRGEVSKQWTATRAPRGWQNSLCSLPCSRTLGWPPIKPGQACWGLSQCLQRVFGRKNCPAVHRGALNRPNSITLSRGGYSPRDACTACPGRHLVTISLEETHRSNNSAKTWPY